MLQSFTYRSSSISYSLTGQGKPIVLLHGFGEDSKVWNEQVAFLQQQFTVIVPDLPGTGLSGVLSGENITIEDYADCLHALLEDAGIHTCIMLGHSMGGYITLAFAEKYSTYLVGFGLVHSTAFADSDEKKKTREKGIAFMEQQGAYAFLKTSIPGLFGEAFKERHPEKIEAHIAAAKHFRKESLQQYYHAMMRRRDRTAVLQSSTVPVLFILGTEDIAAPLSEVLQQVHLPGISSIHILQGAGHMGIWEESAQVNHFIQEFAEMVYR